MHLSITTARISPSIIAVSTLLWAQSALAAPAPKNDDFADALVITSSPFTDRRTTTGATFELADPVLTGPDCAGVKDFHTVWYTYTAPADQLIHADTFGSDYDTVLSAFTLEPSESLNQVACNDDYYQGQSAVDIQATAGTKYYFMVGSFFSSPNAKLKLQFNFEVDPPLEIDIDILQVIVDEGQAYVSLDSFCSRPVEIELEGLLTQKFKGDVSSAAFGPITFACEGNTSFDVPPFPQPDGPFVPGKAVLELSASAEDGGDIATFEDEQTVTLIP
ncbi:hypothetical protein [Nannocystis radixulma]|uniref:Uncharacterized protein n=1 Tax=Nannocystis radixulma TaxID=2995305 RepID=A0ABT5B539_9BACT|nr:hypothetical protein [Nannocystis radixulma]MDC0669206.1 hypothetical protein [Nannocystis radixulma]